MIFALVQKLGSACGLPVPILRARSQFETNMRAYEFIVEVDPIQIQQGPDISPELRRYKERGTLDTFMPDKREPGAQDILGPGQIRQMRAVQNVAPSPMFPKSGAAGSAYSPPKYDTTPVIPVSPKYLTTFEPPEKAQSINF